LRLAPLQRAPAVAGGQHLTTMRFNHQPDALLSIDLGECPLQNVPGVNWDMDGGV
jgi:hypothetical protein